MQLWSAHVPARPTDTTITQNGVLSSGITLYTLFLKRMPNIFMWLPTRRVWAAFEKFDIYDRKEVVSVFGIVVCDVSIGC
jgi:hypothetical protein